MTQTSITTRASLRRAGLLLLGWLVAAALAGIPAGAASPADAQPRAHKAPVVVNTGPECFAGHAAAPAPSSGRD